MMTRNNVTLRSPSLIRISFRISLVNHGLSLYLTITVLSEINDHDASVTFLQFPKSVSVSYKREVWLYDKFDK
jgi:hypothetical protein